MTEKTCGALGCTNDAIGKVPHKGTTVWTCQSCASTRQILNVEYGADQ